MRDDCYVGCTHRSLQDNLKSTVHSMFTVPNVFGVWHRTELTTVATGLRLPVLGVLWSVWLRLHSLRQKSKTGCGPVTTSLLDDQLQGYGLVTNWLTTPCFAHIKGVLEMHKTRFLNVCAENAEKWFTTPCFAQIKGVIHMCKTRVLKMCTNFCGLCGCNRSS